MEIDDSPYTYETIVDAPVIRLENPYLGDIVKSFQEVVSHFQNDK